VELEAMIATLSLSTDNWVDDSAWKYNAERENGTICKFHQEKEPVKCPVREDLVKYLANRKKDQERSQSNPQCMRNDVVWCYRKERIDQEAIHYVLRTGLSKERRRGRGSLNGQSGRRN
jgi:hypothetical protein